MMDGKEGRRKMKDTKVRGEGKNRKK